MMDCRLFCESEETSFWIDKTMQSSLVKEWIRTDADPAELVKEALTDIYAERAQAI